MSETMMSSDIDVNNVNMDKIHLDSSVETSHFESNEFNYRPIPLTAILGFICGLGTSLALLFPVGVVLGLLGLIFGLQATLKIIKFPQDYSGKLLAMSGLMLSALFTFGGISLHAYNYVTEVPDGYERVSFISDIAKKEFVNKKGMMDFHDDVKQLDNKDIFLKGYMYPTRQTEGLTNFILCKDNGQCCFGGKPKLTDMILVQMKSDPVKFRETMVSVAGTFKLIPNSGGELNPVYALETVHFNPARTSF